MTRASSLNPDPRVGEVARLAISATFKGKASKEIEIVSGNVCGYRFKAGLTYVVVASVADGRLTADVCGGTVPIDAAAPELAYLTGVRRGQRGANVYGSIRSEVITPDAYRPDLIRVVLSSASNRFEVPLNRQFGFEVNFVPPGTYTVSLLGADAYDFHGLPPDPLEVTPTTIDVSARDVSLMLKVRRKE